MSYSRLCRLPAHRVAPHQGHGKRYGEASHLTGSHSAHDPAGRRIPNSMMMRLTRFAACIVETAEEMYELRSERMVPPSSEPVRLLLILVTLGRNGGGGQRQEREISMNSNNYLLIIIG